MNNDASIHAGAVTVDFALYNANPRSIDNQFICYDTGGRVGRDPDNQFTASSTT